MEKHTKVWWIKSAPLNPTMEVTESVAMTQAEYESRVRQLAQDLTTTIPDAYKQLMPGNYKDYSKGITMQRIIDFHVLKGLLEAVVDKGLDGDVYETGSWRGGCSIFMVKVPSCLVGVSKLRRLCGCRCDLLLRAEYPRGRRSGGEHRRRGAGDTRCEGGGLCKVSLHMRDAATLPLSD
jgi:hypothetical protein